MTDSKLRLMPRLNFWLTLPTALILMLGGAPALGQILTEPEATPAPDSAACEPDPARFGRQLDLIRLRNLARQTAQTENGGLGLYRTEPAMHGTVLEMPCVELEPNLWQLAFRGGDPLGVSQGNYSTVTLITVDGRQRPWNITINYNGPIQQYPGPRLWEE